jgi:hypothetical protein
MAATASQFNDSAGRRKSVRGGFPVQRCKHRPAGHFSHHAAAFTDEQNGPLIRMAMAAGHIGIAAFDLVDKPMGLQEIQRPIDADGSRCWPLFAFHPRHDFIGTDRLMALGEMPQHIAPQSRQPRATAGANTLSPFQHGAGTGGMVMAGIGKGVFVHGGHYAGLC